jgi:hypothetical protein
LKSISLFDALYGQRGISAHNEYQSNCIKERLQLKNKLDWGERGGMFSEGVWGWENWNVTEQEEEDSIAFREHRQLPKKPHTGMSNAYKLGLLIHASIN